MRPETEAEEIRALGEILGKGFIYRGLKPVNWCFDCQSALAEAEVEYKDRQSPTLDVAFPISDEDRASSKTSSASSWKTDRRRYLDNDTVDHSCQPGFEHASGSGVRSR